MKKVILTCLTMLLVVTGEACGQTLYGDLTDSLKTVGGHFPSPESMAYYGFQGDKSRFRTIWRKGENILTSLVSCIDSPALTKTTVNGKPVLHGAMCLQALEGMIYYEYWDERGNEPLSAEWEGAPGVDATAEELVLAKSIWKEIVDKRYYVLRDIPELEKPDTLRFRR